MFKKEKNEKERDAGFRKKLKLGIREGNGNAEKIERGR